MPNQPGIPPNQLLSRGDIMPAIEVRKIVEMLAKTIVGGEGINVRTFGNQVIVENTQTKQGGGTATRDEGTFTAINNTGGGLLPGQVVVSDGTDTGTAKLLAGKAIKDSQTPVWVVAAGTDVNGGDVELWHTGTRVVELSNPGAVVIDKPVGTEAGSLSAKVGNRGVGLCAGTSAKVIDNGFDVQLGLTFIRDIVFDEEHSLVIDGEYTYEVGDHRATEIIDEDGNLQVTTDCVGSIPP